MQRRLVVLALFLGLAVLVVSTPASALHWQVGVSYGPTRVPMESVQTFTITLRNNGLDPVAVHSVQVTFDWVVQGFVYTVSNQVFNLAPANERSLTVSVDIPRLVQDSVHDITIFVTAETSGDLFAEQGQFNGQVTVTSAPFSSGAGALVLIGVGVLVAAVIVAVILALVLRKRKPGAAPPGPVMSAVVPPPPPPTNAHPCPTCGRPLTFVAEYQRWFCTAENRYV